MMRFTTTQWSQVLAARDGTGTDARLALATLCEAYWYPLYTFVRRQGYDADPAADLTQGYFSYLLEKKILDAVDPSAGRFRSFLLVSLKHYLSHEREKERAFSRSGATKPVSLDQTRAEERYRREPADELTPDQVFERRWALTILERAMDRLRDEFSENGGQRRFELLKQFLTGEEPHTPHRHVARELGMSEGAVRIAVRRMRQRYGHFLREEIAGTVASPDEVDEELRHLLEVTAPWRSGS